MPTLSLSARSLHGWSAPTACALLFLHRYFWFCASSFQRWQATRIRRRDFPPGSCFGARFPQCVLARASTRPRSTVNAFSLFLRIALISAAGMAQIAASPTLAGPTSTTTTAPLSGDDSSAIARAERLVNELRSGDVDRSQLSAKLNAKLSPAALQQAIALVRTLGPTTAWTLSGKTTTADATTYALRVGLQSGESRAVPISIDSAGKISGFGIGRFDESPYVQAQRLVDVGGRRMNLYCSGTGSPTVILDAGLGNTTVVWARVQRPIAQHTRVCSYDRAGMGFSDPTTSARDAGAVVRDLHALLRAAGIAPPYVLVGHSLAGLYSRLYTDRYPRDVVGLVLIDPVTEDDRAVYQRIAPTQTSLADVLNTCATDMAKCALGTTVKIKKSLEAAGCPQAEPASCATNEIIAEQHGRPSFWKDEYLEVFAGPTSAAQVRAEQRPYGNLPLIVLSAGVPDTDEDPVASAQQRAIWEELGHVHERIAALSSRGVHRVVAGSGHSIQIERPSAVISAVDEVVDQVR